MPFHIEESPMKMSDDAKIAREARSESRWNKAWPTFAVLSFEYLAVSLLFLWLTFFYVSFVYMYFPFIHLDWCAVV